MSALTNKIFLVSESVISESLENGLALTRIGSEKILILNATGTAIWQLLDGHTPCHQIATEIARQFSMPVDQVRQDVYTLIERLASMGVIIETDEHNIT